MWDNGFAVNPFVFITGNDFGIAMCVKKGLPNGQPFHIK